MGFGPERTLVELYQHEVGGQFFLAGTGVVNDELYTLTWRIKVKPVRSEGDYT